MQTDFENIKNEFFQINNFSNSYPSVMRISVKNLRKKNLEGKKYF